MTGYHMSNSTIRAAFLIGSLFGISLATAEQMPSPVDTMSDTWAATDGLGRTVIGSEQVGPPKTGKFIGIFYFLWLEQNGASGPYDVTKILAQDPDAMLKPDSPLWGPLHYPHYWGEPLFGYYRSDDAWVLAKHAQMLSDAGVDAIIFDVSNQVTYPQIYTRLCEVFTQLRRQDRKTPQIAFLTPFWDPSKVADKLYAELYKPNLFSDVWFRWKGKPLMLADPAKVAPEIREFFTLRKPQPDYFQGPTGPNQWGWLEIYPQHAFYNTEGKPEQATVGIGQNGSGKRLCAFSEKNTYGRSWHDGKKDTRPDAVNYGYNVEEQWKRALEIDPEFIFITGWNEWIAGRFGEFNKVREPVMFVDQYTQEYSRDIEPMKGGHFDNYYYQMVSYIRRFKGAHTAPARSSLKTIKIDGDFSDWAEVRPEYRDDLGDTMRRNHPGNEKLKPYVNNTGRNDFVLLKVVADANSVYFYARTAGPITPHTDRDWMLLLIDADHNPTTGWQGYDFIVNRQIKDAATSTIEACRRDFTFQPASKVSYQVKGNEMELAIPRSLLGLKDPSSPIRFDFKWADNTKLNGDVAAFILNGDTAPNSRFNYRY